MPTNLSAADASFPQLTEKQSTDEKIEKIQSYLYMLLESLRFQLSNIEKENFNDTAFEEISDIITEPVYAQISDVKGNVTSLGLTADGLSLQIQNANGEIATLVSRADILASQMTDAEGDISTLTQQADALTTSVSNNKKSISTLQQTATSLSSRVTTAEGNASTALQTAQSITLSVTNNTDSSTIQLSADGIATQSKTIKFTGDVVFASNLTDGKTTISGSNITTGTITGRTISGGTITGATITGNTISGGTITSAKLYSPTIYGSTINIYGEDDSASFNLWAKVSGSYYNMLQLSSWDGGINAKISSPAGGEITLSGNVTFVNGPVYFYDTVDFTNATVKGLS